MQKPYRIAASTLIVLTMALAFVGCATKTIPVPEEGVTVVAALTTSADTRAGMGVSDTPVVGKTYKPGDKISLVLMETVTLQAADGRTWTLTGGEAKKVSIWGGNEDVASDYLLVKESDEEDQKQEDAQPASASNNPLVTTGIVAGSVVAIVAAIEATKGDSDPVPPLSP